MTKEVCIYRSYNTTWLTHKHCEAKTFSPRNTILQPCIFSHWIIYTNTPYKLKADLESWACREKCVLVVSLSFGKEDCWKMNSRRNMLKYEDTTKHVGRITKDLESCILSWLIGEDTLKYVRRRTVESISGRCREEQNTKFDNGSDQNGEGSDGLDCWWQDNKLQTVIASPNRLQKCEILGEIVRNCNTTIKLEKLRDQHFSSLLFSSPYSFSLSWSTIGWDLIET